MNREPQYLFKGDISCSQNVATIKGAVFNQEHTVYNKLHRNGLAGDVTTFNDDICTPDVKEVQHNHKIQLKNELSLNKSLYKI